MAQHGDGKHPEKQVQKHHKNPFVFAVSVIILSIIVVSFVFFGPSITDGMVSPVTVFGSYDGYEINDVEDSYMMTTAYQYAQQIQQNDIFSQATVLSRAYDDSVLHFALLSLARSLGLHTSDYAVYKELATYPSFQDAKGKLDTEKLAARQDLPKLMADTRDQITHDYLMRSIVAGTQVSSQEQEFINETYKKRRVLDLVIFDQADYPDAEVIAFAKANKDRFSQASLASITVATKDAADKISAEIKKNPDVFADLAKENSTDAFKDKGGAWDPTFLYSLSSKYSDEKLVDQLKGLKANEVLGPVSVNGEYLIVKALKDVAEPELSTPAQFDLVRNYIAEQERGTLEDYLANKARDFAVKARSAGFAVQAQADARKVDTSSELAINTRQSGDFDPFTIQTFYGNMPIIPSPKLADGSSIADAATNSEFFERAFSLKAGEVSDPVVMNGKVVVLSLKEEKVMEESEANLFTAYLPSIIRQLNTNDIKATVIDKAKWNDRFQDGIRKWVAKSGAF